MLTAQHDGRLVVGELSQLLHIPPAARAEQGKCAWHTTTSGAGRGGVLAAQAGQGGCAGLKCMWPASLLRSRANMMPGCTGSPQVAAEHAAICVMLATPPRPSHFTCPAAGTVPWTHLRGSPFMRTSCRWPMPLRCARSAAAAHKGCTLVIGRST